MQTTTWSSALTYRPLVCALLTCLTAGLECAIQKAEQGCTMHVLLQEFANVW